jgi:integrase/recombinase XerC
MLQSVSAQIATLTDARDAFVLNREICGRSRLTILRYRRTLATLPDRWPLEPLDIQGWIVRARERGLQPSSLFSDLAAVRAFCRWAMMAGLLTQDPTFGLRLSVPKRLPKVPLQAEVHALVRAASRRPDGGRARAIALLFIDTAVRLAELCRLRWEDFDMMNRQIVVRNAKGAKDRTVYYGATTAQAVQKHLASQGLARPEDWVFPTHTGRAVPRQRVDELLRALSKQATLHWAVSAHKLRHYAATELLRRGADLESVRLILGHSTLAMTQHYLQLLGPDIARAHRRASPVDWLDR